MVSDARGGHRVRPPPAVPAPPLPRTLAQLTEEAFLEVLYRDGASSRAAIAKITGISNPPSPRRRNACSPPGSSSRSARPPVVAAAPRCSTTSTPITATASASCSNVGISPSAPSTTRPDDLRIAKRHFGGGSADTAVAAARAAGALRRTGRYSATGHRGVGGGAGRSLHPHRSAAAQRPLRGHGRRPRRRARTRNRRARRRSTTTSIGRPSPRTASAPRLASTISSTSISAPASAPDSF